MHVEKCKITIQGEEKEYNVRRIPYIKRAAMIDALRGGLEVGQTIPFERSCKYQVALIGESIVDENNRLMWASDGTPLHPNGRRMISPEGDVLDQNGKKLEGAPVPDTVQDWHPVKISDLANFLDRHQNPNVDAVAKNSTSTTSDEPSSTSP